MLIKKKLFAILIFEVFDKVLDWFIWCLGITQPICFQEKYNSLTLYLTDWGMFTFFYSVFLPLWSASLQCPPYPKDCSVGTHRLRERCSSCTVGQQIQHCQWYEIKNEIVCIYISLENNLLIWWPHHCQWREGLHNLGQSSAPLPIDQGEIVIVPHLLWQGGLVFMVLSKKPPKFTRLLQQARGIEDLRYWVF